MPWELDIHVFDVGAGDSSLIIAEDPTANAGTTMLVDAGLNICAQTVHGNITNLVRRLDTILVSHYDQDHSNGVASLLAADTMSVLCEHIAQQGVTELPTGTRLAYIADLAARFAAIGQGAVNGEEDHPALEAESRVKAIMTDAQAAKFGADTAVGGYAYTGPLLVPPPTTCKNMAMAGAIDAADEAAAGGATVASVQDAARSAMFQALSPNLPVGGRFETGGFYRNCRVIDVGQATNPTATYRNAVAGRAKISTQVVQVPGIARQRVSYPAIGSEVLWAGGPPNATAPVAVVVSTPHTGVAAPTGTAWQGPNPPAPFGGDTGTNRVSIGFVLLLGDFSYLSAGDLPSTGEDLVGAALQQYPLPDGHGGQLAAALPFLVCLKCSHHGSASATSTAFLNAVNPATAMISCGFRYDAPAQSVITDLYARAAPIGFWLTNCSYPRAGVPFSQVPPGDQTNTPGNRGYVSGDNNLFNLIPGRVRGDIHIWLTEASATAAQGARDFWLQYQEQSTVPAGPAVATLTW